MNSIPARWTNVTLCEGMSIDIKERLSCMSFHQYISLVKEILSKTNFHKFTEKLHYKNNEIK